VFHLSQKKRKSLFFFLTYVSPWSERWREIEREKDRERERERETWREREIV
jgi:hypothetical protein